MSIQQKVIDVLSDKLSIGTPVDKDTITLDSLLREDLGLDSLGAVEMLFDLESEYDIAISDEDALTFKRVRDIVEYFERRGIK
jgi:acyl carrier protein